VKECVDYAKRNEFRRMVTKLPESNAAMIAINEQNGFRAIRKNGRILCGR